ncbi:DUF3862 domain-containing protein [Psychrobium sp. 1_MG-2023]|uniref:DUF3862 domain-containing protein n=1 Tax=Psychrobium sp. 1_MG-2023 TaxID=3062624 RepID=UPI000C32F593|nr:DUF3862 domain-containing protein [Psychrobium sp. 1_MG-2023]MDP2561097.1 DUF3862 domain-containing protein [Psychrobium sp. 1_MG-2023]PKF58385.1 DUF3862 domain-containing protein [Alteromonadales bacterium alter-6D02]
MKRLTLLAALSASLLLSGCSKITTENYNTLEVGMDFSEVETLLGTASKCDETIGLKQCTWGDADKNINIKFVADKVTLYSKKGI